jgi:hypothetical protein
VTKRPLFPVAAVLAVLCLPSPASAASDPAALALRYAGPWPALQAPDGRFTEYVSTDGRGRYGEAVLGHALLASGLRASDDRFVDAGLRAIGYALRHPEVQEAYPSVFETYALVAAYNLARESLAADPRFDVLRPLWRLRLRSERPVHLRARARYWNKAIVEAAAVLELLRTGMRSSGRRTWLRRRKLAMGRVRRLVNRIIPRRVLRREGRVTLSDPPVNPLAYHALSLGFYARAVSLLGRRAGRKARRVLRGAARTSLAVTAPDGDLAYTGRSQEQAWALSFTAYGAEAAARVSRRREARKLRALIARVLLRLQARHPSGVRGMAIVPAFAQRPLAWFPGLDRYVGAVPYSGLTAVALNLLADTGIRGPAGARIGSDGPMAARIRSALGTMAVMRRGPVWLAVRRGRAGTDLRYDIGLVSLKLLGPVGWQDVIPARARTRGSSLGPTLVRDGAEYELRGRRLQASRRRIGLRGRFGRLRRPVTVNYVPTPCGVELRWRGPPSATYRYSSFFAGRDTPRTVSDRSVAGTYQQVTVSAPATATLTAGYSSAVEPELVRADLVFSAGTSGRVVIAVCGA